MQTCLLMRTWDNALDEKIIRIIENNDGKSYFYQLEKEMGFSRNLRRKTLNEHLKRLERQNIIEKDPNPQIGKKRYIRLTSKAILRKSLDILEGLKSKHVTMRHKKLVMLILGMICRTYSGHIRKDGSIVQLYAPAAGRLTSDLISKYVGVSTSDLENPIYYTDIVNDFSYEEITESINKLSEAKVTRPTFTFTDEVYHSFEPKYEKLIPYINSCFRILGLLLRNMKKKWFYLRKKPTSEEINWFVSIVGKNEMRSFFSSLDEERKLFPEQRKRNYEDMLGNCNAADFKKAILEANRVDKKIIKSTDLTIKRMTEELENKYEDIKMTFPVFYELMKEMIYPSFLH
jgi:DNA-binding HxlR family transcriptional regulator